MGKVPRRLTSRISTMQRGVWREPAEESHDLYPGPCVHDNRVSGSITVGRSRRSRLATRATSTLMSMFFGGPLGFENNRISRRPTA